MEYGFEPDVTASGLIALSVVLLYNKSCIRNDFEPIEIVATEAGNANGAQGVKPPDARRNPKMRSRDRLRQCAAFFVF